MKSFCIDKWITSDYQQKCCHGSRSNDRSKFQDFFRTSQYYKSHKITTYSSIIYGLPTGIRQQKTMDTELSVPIIDAKTMLSFSTLQKLLHQWLAFSGPHAKISRLFTTQVLIQDFPVPEKSKDEFQDFSGPVETRVGNITS